MSDSLRIGTRGSRLALWQAHHVRELLAAARPGLPIEIVTIVPRGDVDKTTPLGHTGGTGFFTKEIEEALLDGRVDVAVHSLKDLPTEIVPGLALAAVPEREDPRDVLVGRAGRVAGVADLGPGFRVATSSPRRRGQILAACPGVEVVPLRGNVPTRLGKVSEEGGPDAVILALAGLLRLDLGDRVTEVMNLETMLPAPAQGALGVEIRESDTTTAELVAPLDDPVARAATAAERAFLRRLEGGCTVPAGALAEPGSDGSLRLRAVVTDPDGETVCRDEAAGDAAAPRELGLALADRMLSGGAAGILDRIREQQR
jgi:hydroxymethylbilane synthase